MVDEDIAIDGIVDAGKLLTLTGHEAIAVGVAQGQADDLDDLLEQLGLDPDNVVTVSVNWAEGLVRFLSNPMVAPILLSLGTLGSRSKHRRSDLPGLQE
jgi:membrane-bound serine protease (ClpP class)